jgi:2-polyprenyl-3-methyl-5-hydroxy-6-metoxy-1,4-benzoquinol methylase
MDTHVCCNLCGADNYEVVYDTLAAPDEEFSIKEYRITDHSVNQSVRIVSCRKCGLHYLNPRPQTGDITSIYVQMNDQAYLEQACGRRRAARPILDYLKKLRKSGRLLDVGCSAGFLLDEARLDGWDVYGVELSEWAVKHATEKLCLPNITRGALEQAKYPSNFFDAVVLKDVIEHLPDPKATLEEIRRILKPTGILCCNTPDIDSLPSKVLKTRWWGIKQSHLYYFTTKTLQQMLEAAGFVPVYNRTHPRPFTLNYWVNNFAANKPILGPFKTFISNRSWLGEKLVTLDLGDQTEVFARKSRALKFIEELEAPSEVVSQDVHKKVTVVLPAYNAAKTLQKTLDDIPKDVVDEIILVDDCSKDDTIETARKLGLKVFPHATNTGYGGNQKTCYTKALEAGADIVIMVHPDYQYDPSVIPQMIEPILKGRADAVFGSRMMKGGALEGGMPAWKHNANILLTALENVILGIYLTEYHSGFRAYSRKYLERVDFMANSDNFVFDTEIIVQGVAKFMRFEEIPIRTRYFDEASSIKLWPSIVYGLGILKTMFKFVLHQHGIKFKQFK